jgi:phosphocarrier protein HPr
MIERNVTIINKLGLHARAAAKFVQTCSAFSANVVVHKGDRRADGKSIMSVMMLAASKGTELRIEFDGSDEEQSANALLALINNYFDEGE